MAGDLRIASWNVLAQAHLHLEYYEHLIAAPEPVARRSAVGDIVAQLGADVDVICLQEVDAEVAGLVDGRLEGWQVTWARRPGGRPDGSLIATRGGHSAGHRTIDLLGRRSAAVADVDVAGRTVTIASTHLTWMRSDVVDHEGVAEAEDLIHVLGGRHPAVVAGDLNDSVAGPVLSALQLRGFVGTERTSPSAFINGGGRLIDHIVGNGVGLVDVPLRWTADRPLPDEHFPSDHVPIAALVTIP